MKLFQRGSAMLMIILSCSGFAWGQEEESFYPRTFTAKVGMGPTYLAVDYGILIQNKFELELSKLFSLSASYGMAHAYEGLDDVQRWYFPPDIEIQPDDHFRHQNLIFTNIGMQISPLNTKHHRVYLGLGPGLSYHNFTKTEILPHADSIAFVLTNSKTTNFTYHIFAGYDVILGEHIVLGLACYYARFTEMMWSAVLSAGYRF